MSAAPTKYNFALSEQGSRTWYDQPLMLPLINRKIQIWAQGFAASPSLRPSLSIAKLAGQAIGVYVVTMRPNASYSSAVQDWETARVRPECPILWENGLEGLHQSDCWGRINCSFACALKQSLNCPGGLCYLQIPPNTSNQIFPLSHDKDSLNSPNIRDSPEQLKYQTFPLYSSNTRHFPYTAQIPDISPKSRNSANSPNRQTSQSPDISPGQHK